MSPHILRGLSLSQNIVHDLNSTSSTMTSMTSLSRLSRLHHAMNMPFLYPSSYSSLKMPVRRAMMSAIHSQPDGTQSSSQQPTPSTSSSSTPTPKIPLDAAAPQVAARPPPAPRVEKPRPTIRSTKAALTMTPRAVTRLRSLLSGPTPQLIRIGVRNKGCAGLSYHLEYVEKSGRFDEVVEQDGVKVFIDSKALFSIIGSEMDWSEDPLSARFTFKNPNITDACGCGESFTVGS